MKKTCTKCKRILDISRFHSDAQKRNGLYSSCNDCSNKQTRKKYAARKSQYHAARKVSITNTKNHNKIHGPKNPLTEKLCPGCGTVKPASTFGHESRSQSGLRPRCIQCTNDYNRDYRGTEQGRAVIHNSRHRRRSRMQDTFTAAELRRRLAAFGRKCAYCGGPYEELDHIIPLSRGGSNKISNIVPSCVHCNRSKRNLPVGQFLANIIHK